VLTHVLNDAKVLRQTPPTYARPQIEAVLKRARDFAEERLAKVDLGDGLEVVRRVERGVPAPRLVDVARDEEAALIVVGAEGKGAFRRAVLGSVSNSLIRVADRPVLVVGGAHPAVRAFERVVAAVDLSAISSLVIGQAAMAVRPGGTLTVLSYYEQPFAGFGDDAGLAPLLADAALEARATEHRAEVQSLVDALTFGAIEVRIETRGHLSPSHGIIEFLETDQSDLCVVGTSGHNLWNRFVLGSTTPRVLAEATCPVLVVPHGMIAGEPATEGASRPERAAHV
jgi:nucleotide-binding universal stress UspA family protein